MQEEAINQISSLVENTSYLTWDLLVILLFLGGILFYFYTFGKDHIISFLVALYISGFAIFSFPFISNLKSLIKADDYISSIIIFIILFFLISAILLWNGFFDPYVIPTGVEVALFGIAFAGFLFVLLGSLMSSDMIVSLSPLIRLMFSGDIAFASWSLAPLGLFILIRGDT